MKPFRRRSLRELSESRLRRFSFSREGKSSLIKDFVRRFKKTKSVSDLPSHKPQRSFWKTLFWIFLGLSGIGFLTFGILLIVVLSDLPDVTNPGELTFSESTVLFARDGSTPLYSVHGDQNRKIVPLGEMPKSMISAILAAEDDEFYSHPGFDIGGIAMAACYKLTHICNPRGGSTLTQQIVKNIFLSNERTITRKLREILLSYRLEQNLTKDQILELYLNGIPFGSNLYGVETASNAFFGKSVREISIAQSAILAGIINLPTYYSPSGANAFSRVITPLEEIEKNNYETFNDINDLPGISWKQGLVGKNIELANGKTAYFPGRADWVVKRMRELGYISQEDFDAAKQELVTFTFAQYREEITAPHFVFLVKNELVDKFSSDLVEHGGLKVITTLDIENQKMAEEAIKNHREKNVANYNAHNEALVALDPESGEIKALVGSADYWDDEIDGKVNMILAKRQPGSSFKPIVYATAFATGVLSPASVLMDVETDFGNDWKPKNYDGTFSGPVSVRYALGHSLNIPAVKAAILAGPKAVYDFAKSLGIQFDFDANYYGAAIALGGAEVRPLDMATAFSTLINGGKKVVPIAILRVEDRFGNVLFEYDPPEEPEQIVNPKTAFLIDNVLSDPTARADWGSVLSIGRPAMAKTGTSNEAETGLARDTWTVGGTPNFSVVVWSGNNEPSKVPLGKNAGGSSTAAPIWRDFLIASEKDIAPRDFSVPSGISRVLVSKLSGKLPNPDTPSPLLVEDVFESDFVPTETDNHLLLLEVDRVSGKLPTEETPEKAIRKIAVLNFHAFDPTRENWETPVREWVEEHGAEFLQSIGIGDEILAEEPKEYDDVHTSETAAKKPKFTFESPANGDLVAPPKITVSLDITAQNGMGEVDFFWDKKAVFSEKSGKNFIVKIPKNASGKHTLTAVVTDALFYESSASVEVTIGKDKKPPTVTLSTPTRTKGEQTVKISAEAYDEIGAISKVEFFADGNRIGIDLFAPYETNWTPENVAGKVTLKAVATDTAGNTASDKTKVTVEKSGISTTFEILSPRNGGTVACEKTLFQIGISPEMIAGFEKMTLLARKTGNDSEFAPIAKTTKRTRFGFLSIEWTPVKCGEWEFVAENGDKKRSPKIKVKFQ